ncbi:protein gvpI [Haloferax mediterranei ATCC 33500]|uniref:Gas vesicle protein I n=2 Tax=Haloferax mediterranei (strain ATCC 33500 / DSM 1411 / JCM 8866 / NBRC 14739 / NCIMB 2177 / R-4) TaxID=523841 RepID=GVPI_HALMT|nr:protein gvpI [Haloferax mediterranei]Q02234.1 RecName: Full=Gas vesicle protein I; Short=GvpI [Haloferax mediterranei ATCC 33500]AFK19408.1 gas-vesicle operon protein gvpI [Haloferax mediterranei ATCC 33500]AHZ21242.1 protein gvpI [Haloferax mediterranei ATCC 33500]EMA04403.1 gas-vesicle operon protein gvpI [Haloferax mediterranei ATCC 33500]MDX5989511.1 protein gvpI [Haloferax mediterranei ATCC 33500]QCQ75870.1 protein gvpI [Haloferax mediterranei ATCC 33500]
MTGKQHQKHEQKARQAQVKAQINRDKARSKLLRQREKLARRRARNRRQSEVRRGNQSKAQHDTQSETQRGTQSKSQRDNETGGTKNPTAHSTLPPQKTNAENAVRNSHSTVPELPKYSSVPARERLYGLRLHRETTASEDKSVTVAVTRAPKAERQRGGADE